MERNEAIANLNAVFEDRERLKGETLRMAIAALSDPWVKCSDRLPAAEDADQTKRVMVWIGRVAWHMFWDDVETHWRNGFVTHWMTPVAGPGEG